MYKELILELRDKAEFLSNASRYSSAHNSFAETMTQAADAIEELQDRVTVSKETIKRQSDIIKAKDRDLQRIINATSRTEVDT